MKPIAILDPHWRQMRELISEADEARLRDLVEVVWGQDDPIPEDLLANALPEASFLIASMPELSAAQIAAAPNLRAVIEVSGAFPATIDYDAAFARNLPVLSCAPGFAAAVAEMALGMAIAGGRGIVAEHEGFRAGQENWLADNPATDFTLYGAAVGFVGFGKIAQETLRLLRPFAPAVRVFDPWLPEAVAAEFDVRQVSLEEAMAARLVYVMAAPTAENKGMIAAEALAQIPDGGLLAVISRAHLVDFDALTEALRGGRFRAAIDVFPEEPMPPDHPIRSFPNVILSPHRAAAVAGGRQPIGRMIVKDIAAILQGHTPQNLQLATPDRVALLAGVGDAKSVGVLAAKR